MTSLNARLLNVLSPDRESSTHIMYERKVNQFSFRVDEHELVYNALTSGDKNLASLIATAIWAENRTMLCVIITAHPYCGVIMNHVDRTRPAQEVEELYKSIMRTSASLTALPDAAYQRISSVLNARYLSNVLRLTADGLLTDLDYTEQITMPLVQNEEIVLNALHTIMGLKNALPISTRWTVDQVFDIADLIRETPEASQYVIDFATERKSYDGALIREQLSAGSLALTSGTL